MDAGQDKLRPYDPAARLHRALGTPDATPASQAERFAESILARYSGRFTQLSRTSLVYQRPEHGWVFNQVLHRTSSFLTLRLALHLATTPSPRHDAHTAELRTGTVPLVAHPSFPPMTLAAVSGPVSDQPGGNGSSHFPASLDRHPVTVQRTIQHARLVQLTTARMVLAAPPDGPTPLAPPSRAPQPATLGRAGRIVLAVKPALAGQMMTRGQRVPMAIARSASGRAGGEVIPAPAARPVPRIVHVTQQPAPPQPAPAPDPFGRPSLVSSHGEHAAIWPPRARGQAGEIQANGVLPLGQHEINRLADQVVQVIDGRVIAHRERMGRI